MFGLSDIFTPSFLIILGILVLFVSLLVLYIENKARVHEHQLNSMLSLVSSLAEEVNTIRYNFMTYNGGGSVPSTNDFSLYNGVGEGTVHFNNNLEKKLEIHLEKRNELISVSDNEDDEEEEEDTDEEDNDDNEDNEDTDDEEDNDDDNSLKTTIIKLNISSNNNDLKEERHPQEIIEIGNDSLDTIKVLKVESLKKELEDLEEYFEELEQEQEQELAQELAQELEQKNELDDFEIENSSHKININIHKMDDLIDYKKLPLQRLKTIVMEKKLLDDSSKLKKQDLLKLLGIE
jgi:hypothetical protein